MITQLTQFAETASAEETKTGVAALGIDPRAFIIQLITFLLVYLILKKYVFSRIFNALKKRQDTIDKGVKLSTDLSKQKDELDREVAETRKAARKEAEKIVADSHAEATQMIRDAETAASAKADNVLAEAQKKIDDETRRARRDLEKEMVELVIQATEKVAGQKLDATKDGALINQALKGQA